jgi:hypothetical protein
MQINLKQRIRASLQIPLQFGCNSSAIPLRGSPAIPLVEGARRLGQSIDV